MVLLERYRYDDYTKMLLHGNGSNGSTEISDICGLRTMTAVGNAQISTAQSKFGGTSMSFDGTNSRIYAADSSDFTLGSANWTVDFWVYLNSQKNYNAVCSHRLGPSSSHNFTIMINSSGNVYFAYTGGNTTFTTTISTSTWTHIAVVREGDNIKVYKGGVLSGTYTLTTGYTFTESDYEFQIGASRSDSTTYGNWINGYIDEFRFSKGVARWTGDFTPPVAQY